MRVIRAGQFLSLPEGAMFCEGFRWSFDELRVKGETIEVNGKACGYWSRSLCWVDGDGMSGSENDTFNRLEAMLAADASFPVNTAYDKTLTVEDDSLFLVYEEADLMALCAAAQAAMGASVRPK